MRVPYMGKRKLEYFLAALKVMKQSKNKDWAGNQYTGILTSSKKKQLLWIPKRKKRKENSKVKSLKQPAKPNSQKWFQISYLQNLKLHIQCHACYANMASFPT